MADTVSQVLLDKYSIPARVGAKVGCVFFRYRTDRAYSGGVKQLVTQILTDNHVIARLKLSDKSLDMIVLNQVGAGTGPDSDTNQVTVSTIDSDPDQVTVSTTDNAPIFGEKKEIAARLLGILAEVL